MNEKNKVIFLGIGAFSPVLYVAAKVLGIGILATIASLAFAFAWIYMLVDVVRQRRWDGSKKVAWCAGIVLFGVIAVPIYWWTEIRGKQKWREAYERVSF